MSKAYSSKALPAGTVVREWRLEDVLGVGGFGIVYKGRGIYFGELVAIKEYFPSSISERDSEKTVVPIGSDVEEVHALGLKKFVEEAKLLWNLSTPTRHPNIVSVRSLFEIHGTAYMVMDFEDGVSLSKLLKEGRRFNERSLWNIIKPVAEGLDRAHRVGVLHRDIKPPNILITDDSRPVLIDFGSARFEAAEATSTSVTFHTPPYAAVEQYVKTYPQGPWTDIYALAVVLYECVTGEKPPEVLERLHGGLGTPLAEGTWPGFSKRFLQAIDAGMTIRPTERPQSIREWLALFGKKDVEPEVAGDDEPTRFFAHEVTAEEIIPVAPRPKGSDPKEPLATGVPDDPKEVQFKLAGQDTGASKRKKKAGAAEPAKPEEPAAAPASAKPEPPPPSRKAAALAGAAAAEPAQPWYKNQRTALIAGGGALALSIAAVVGVFTGGSDTGEGGVDTIPGLAEPPPIVITDVGGLAPAMRALAGDARTAGVPAPAVAGLAAAAEQLDKQFAVLQPIMNDPAQATAANTRLDEMKRTVVAASLAFSNALLSDSEGRTQRLSAEAAATPAGTRARRVLDSLRSTVQSSAASTDPSQSLNAARNALAQAQALAAAVSAAQTVQVATKRPTATAPQAPAPTAVTPTQAAPTATATAPATPAATPSPTAGASGSKRAQLNSIIASGRSMAKQVMRTGSKENAALARNYDRYLANVADSARGADTDRELDDLIKQANQTKAYIVFLNKQPSGN